MHMRIVYAYVYALLLMHMCIYIHNNETMMADCTIKDSIYV